jgi:hypothetical protein
VAGARGVRRAVALALTFGTAVLVLAAVCVVVVLLPVAAPATERGWWRVAPIVAGFAAYVGLGVAIFRWFGRMFRLPRLPHAQGRRGTA